MATIDRPFHLDRAFGRQTSTERFSIPGYLRSIGGNRASLVGRLPSGATAQHRKRADAVPAFIARRGLVGNLLYFRAHQWHARRLGDRSEERRVGKEGRSRWSADH